MSTGKNTKSKLEQLTESFEKYADRATKLPNKPSDAVMLELYGYYKQSKLGKNTNSAPWAFQVEAKAKWTAWNKLGDMSKEDAMTKYINLVKKLEGK